MSSSLQVEPLKATTSATQPIPRRRMKLHIVSWWWLLPALALIVMFHFIVVALGAYYAFTDWNGIGIPSFVGVENFLNILESARARTGLFNTLAVAGLSLAFTNILGLCFALALNRQLKSRNFLRASLFAPVVLSPLAVSYVWKYIFDQTGPLNTALESMGLSNLQKAWLADPSAALATIVIVMVWQHVGLAMVMYLAGLANIPVEVEEAAAVDGSNTWMRFIHITVPLLRPTVIVASTLILIQSLKVFDQILALTGGGPFGATETLATLVYKETFVNGKYGYGAALSLILTIVVLIFAVLQVVLLRKKGE